MFRCQVAQAVGTEEWCPPPPTVAPVILAPATHQCTHRSQQRNLAKPICILED